VQEVFETAMGAWAKMAMMVAVAVLPGGLLFLLGWALGRAFMIRYREASESGQGRAGLYRALGSIRLRDLWREARAMSGLFAPPTHHPASM
jgi:hypothetical protein